MLGEVAITPDVLAEGSHQNPAAADVYLQMLKEPLLHEVMVRNLRAGDWYRELAAPDRGLSPRGKEVLRKLHDQRRLRVLPACRATAPDSDADWCHEALDSHETDAVDCIVTTEATKQTFATHALVTNLERICSHAWWMGRTCSIRLRRTTDDYLKYLDRLLRSTNSLMFIDPHFDPQEGRYGEFWKLLARASRPVAPPRIEIHRVCRKRDNRTQGGWRVVQESEWESIFETHLKPRLAGLSLRVEVFIWDDFHDRYLISDLMGISVPIGFDIDNSVNNLTTWTRLDRNTRDDIQREFDPTCRRHRLHHQFTL